jgi:hypothetical protein
MRGRKIRERSLRYTRGRRGCSSSSSSSNGRRSGVCVYGDDGIGALLSGPMDGCGYAGAWSKIL